MGVGLELVWIAHKHQVALEPSRQSIVFLCSLLCNLPWTSWHCGVLVFTSFGCRVLVRRLNPRGMWPRLSDCPEFKGNRKPRWRRERLTSCKHKLPAQVVHAIIAPADLSLDRNRVARKQWFPEIPHSSLGASPPGRKPGLQYSV